MEKLEKKNSGDFVSKEQIRVFIEPLAKPQLVDLLSQLGSKYPSIAQEIQSFANVDRGLRKLNEGNVMLDRDTGKSAQTTFKPPRKLVHGVCKLADDDLTKTIRWAAYLSKRILYIENLSAQVTREILLNHFERHGDIEECVLAYQRHDKSTVSRSAFITYKTAEAAKNAMKDLDQSTLEGKTITVKYADFPNDGGRQPSVPARVSPIAALHTTPEYVEGYPYPRTAAPTYPYPRTAAPYAASSPQYYHPKP